MSTKPSWLAKQLIPIVEAYVKEQDSAGPHALSKLFPLEIQAYSEHVNVGQKCQWDLYGNPQENSPISERATKLRAVARDKDKVLHLARRVLPLFPNMEESRGLKKALHVAYIIRAYVHFHEKDPKSQWRVVNHSGSDGFEGEIARAIFRAAGLSDSHIGECDYGGVETFDNIRL